MSLKSLTNSDLEACVQHLSNALGYPNSYKSVVESNVYAVLTKIFSEPQNWDEPGVIIDDEIQVGSSKLAEALLNKLQLNSEGNYLNFIKDTNSKVNQLIGFVSNDVDGTKSSRFGTVETALESISRQLDVTIEDSLSNKVANLKDSFDGESGLTNKINGTYQSIQDHSSGLEAIKNVVDTINSAVSSESSGLSAIKSDAAAIKQDVESSTTGLTVIKGLADDIKGVVRSETSGLAVIEQKLSDSTSGLAQIKSAIDTANQALDSATNGLGAIKTAIGTTETNVKDAVGSTESKLTTLINTTEKQYLLDTQKTVTDNVKELMTAISNAQNYCVNAYEDWVDLASRIATKEIQVSSSADNLQSAIEDATDLVNSLDSIREIVISFSDIVNSTKGLSDSSQALIESANALLPFMKDSVTSNQATAKEMEKVNESVSKFVQSMDAAKILAEQMAKLIAAYSDVESKKLIADEKRHTYDSKLEVANTISRAVESLAAVQTANKKEVRL